MPLDIQRPLPPLPVPGLFTSEYNEHRISPAFYRRYLLLAFVPHLVNQHIDNLFSLWAASIDKHIASLAAGHCAFFLSLHLL